MSAAHASAAPSLQGAVAVVLGAGSGPDGVGNGAAIACTYAAAAGATVVVGDIDAAAAEATVEMITGAGDEAFAACVDVTSSEELTELAGRHGQVDVLHNNVGISRLGSPPELSEADWRLVIDTNLTGVFLACRAFLPAMRAAGRGAVVNTSSVAGAVHTGYDYSAYYAAKAGLNHFTRTLAVQLAPDGVRVNAVLPGMIDTPLIYRQMSGAYASVQDMVAERNRSVPLGRMGSVWEVATASLFLASDAASYVTGVCLAVDGGLSARWVCATLRAMDENVLVATRRSLHAVAEHLMAGPQYRESGTIRLRASPGGFSQVQGPVRVDGTDLVAGDRRVPLTGTISDVAAAADLTPGVPEGLYDDHADRVGELAVDPVAAGVLADWFDRGDAGLRAFAGPGSEPVIWPEHFDLAISLDEVNYGVSPGDAGHPGPYAYVGPWTPREGPFWNAPFGAVRSADELPDAAAVAAFFTVGRAAAG